MGITIGSDNERPEGRPSLKLRNVGDHADVMLVYEHQRPRYVYNPNPDAPRRPLLDDNGKQKTQDVLEVIYLDGNGVVADNGADRPAQPGEILYVYVAGRDRWDRDGDKQRGKGEAKSWSGAKKDHGRLTSGDVVRWKFEAEVPGQGDRDRKIRTFRVRAGKPDELAEHEATADEIAVEWQRYYREHGTAIEVEDDEPQPAEATTPPRPAYADETPF
jgi:hypothetical protein